jgi:hypothetical protein
MTAATRARTAIGTLVRRATAPAAQAAPAGFLARDDAPPQGVAGPWVFGSGVCREAHFHMPLFAAWCERLREPLRLHRKLWEFVYIAQVLAERGALAPGARGVGFGVGREPLVALFASLGADVLATDVGTAAAIEAGWVRTGQHADSLADLNARGICDAAAFDARVRYRTVDMNAMPDDLQGFDFCWSSCACEHLGSIERGLAFLRRSLGVLRGGGIAVHTTELNLTSATRTIDRGSTVLFRRPDLESLAATLRADGHAVSPIDFAFGADAIERYVDLPPYRAEPHLRVALAARVRWYETTSVGLVVVKGDRP